MDGDKINNAYRVFEYENKEAQIAYDRAMAKTRAQYASASKAALNAYITRTNKARVTLHATIDFETRGK